MRRSRSGRASVSVTTARGGTAMPVVSGTALTSATGMMRRDMMGREGGQIIILADRAELDRLVAAMAGTAGAQSAGKKSPPVRAGPRYTHRTRGESPSFLVYRT